MRGRETAGHSGGFEAENLSSGYRDRPVLKGISFSLAAGELVVLAGPNGSGKTTLLKTLAGLLRPLSGRVLMAGRDIGGLKNRERAALCAYLFQESGPRWPFTVEELVSQGAFHRQGSSVFAGGNPASGAAVKQALEAAGLGGFEGRPVTELSGGEFQRVLIARALVQEARFFLLDEPVNNLDPRYQLMVMDLVKALTRRGISALVSLHDLNLAALYADRIALLAGGELKALAPPAEALQKEALEKIFDTPLGVASHPEAPEIPLVFPPLTGPR